MRFSTRKVISLAVAACLCAVSLCACAGLAQATQDEGQEPQITPVSWTFSAPEDVTYSSMTFEQFTIDNHYQSAVGDIPFSLYVPDSYDASEPYALYVALSGMEGFYEFGPGTNLNEHPPFAAPAYNSKMIIVSPQLSDYDARSARQVIALTKMMLTHYNIDASKVYLSGYSAGGQTGSIVMGMEPGLYAAFLHMSSRWEGDIRPLVDSRVPVHMVIGQDDAEFNTEDLEAAYEGIVALYRKAGVSEAEIRRLVTFDVKPAEYFGEYADDQHGRGGFIFPWDTSIMGWLFKHQAPTTVEETFGIPWSVAQWRQDPLQDIYSLSK